MNFMKFLLKTVFITIIILGGIFAYYYVTDIKVREDLKKECQGEICPCFNNIVDYRLTKIQAKKFLLYLQSRKIRSGTKILEFTNFSDAKEIMEMFNICQLTPVQDLTKNDLTEMSASENEEQTEEEEL